MGGDALAGLCTTSWTRVSVVTALKLRFIGGGEGGKINRNGLG